MEQTKEQAFNKKNLQESLLDHREEEAKGYMEKYYFLPQKGFYTELFNFNEELVKLCYDRAVDIVVKELIAINKSSEAFIRLERFKDKVQKKWFNNLTQKAKEIHLPKLIEPLIHEALYPDIAIRDLGNYAIKKTVSKRKNHLAKLIDQSLQLKVSTKLQCDTRFEDALEITFKRSKKFLHHPEKEKIEELTKLGVKLQAIDKEGVRFLTENINKNIGLVFPLGYPPVKVDFSIVNDIYTSLTTPENQEFLNSDLQRMLLRIGIQARKELQNIILDSIFELVWKRGKNPKGFLFSSIKTWVWKTASNKAIKMLKKKSLYIEYNDAFNKDEFDNDVLVNYTQIEENNRIVLEKLEELTDTQKKVVEGYVFRGQRHFEIAKELGKSTGAIRGRYLRARNTLKRKCCKDPQFKRKT